MKAKSICIFTESGRTYTFRNIALIHDNETALEFFYTAMSDGKVKRATFMKNRIVGWSTLGAVFEEGS